MVGQPLAEGAVALELGFDVLRQHFVIGEALHHFLLELGELAALVLEQPEI